MKNKTVTLTDNETGKQLVMNVLQPSIGPLLLILVLYIKELGYFTFDPGFVSTASCKSAITYMDGEQGLLAYIEETSLLALKIKMIHSA